MNSKDKVIRLFLDGTIHLSKKDYSFFYNLSKIIKQRGLITTNQSELFDKLVNKYRKQLQKNQKNPDDIIGLSWDCRVVPTLQEYLHSNISVKDNFIEIRSPFKQDFIKQITRYMLPDIENPVLEYVNPFSWDKTDRAYKAEYNTTAFKIAITYSNRYFDKTTYCDVAQSLLRQTEELKSVGVWDPTYKKVGDCYYIAACNEILSNHIQNIQLDTEPATLFTLSKLGIKIDENIVKDDYTLRVASKYIVFENIDNINELIGATKLLNVKYVVFGRDLSYQKQIGLELKNLLQNNEIMVLPEGNVKEITDDYFYMTLNSSNTRHNNATKIIVLKNNRPVNVK